MPRSAASDLGVHYLSVILFGVSRLKWANVCLWYKPRCLKPVLTVCESRPGENTPSDMCAQRRFRSACVFAQSDRNLHWAHLDNHAFKDSPWGQRWHWSDCADARRYVFSRCGSYGLEHLTHCRLNRLPHTTYWKSPFSILDMSGYEMYVHIPREKWLSYLQIVETLIRRRILRRLIWVCTVCQLPI